MNKRGNEELFKFLIGLAISSLIVLSLFYGVQRISDAVLSASPKEKKLTQNFDELMNKIKLSLENSNEKEFIIGTFDLVILPSEIVFGLNNEGDFKVPVNIQIYDEISGLIHKKINLIERPEICKDSSCICKCEINNKIDEPYTKISCNNSKTKCLNLPKEINKIIEGDLFVFYSDENGDFMTLSSRGNNFFVRTDKKVPLSIKKDQDKLIFYYNL